MFSRIRDALVATIVMLCAASAHAIPQLINYQGILTDGGGTPIIVPTSVQFRIWSDDPGGTELWDEIQSVTPDTEGRFNVLLGAVNPIPESALAPAEAYLGLTISPDPEMTPRSRLVSVGYAYRSLHSDSAGAAAWEDIANIPADIADGDQVGGSGGPFVELDGDTMSGGLSIQGGNLELDASGPTSGNILKAGALFIHNPGPENVFVGRGAGNPSSTGVENTACGDSALSAITSGSRNTATGFQTLSSATSTFNSTANGGEALRFNTTGNNNTAAGSFALRFNTTGSFNTAVGSAALEDNTTGSNNTSIGVQALDFNTSGSNNTAIGFQADVSAALLTNATAIGNGAVVNASNKIRLGNSAVTVLECQVGLTVVSDEKQKENFQPVDGDAVLRKIRDLDLPSWNFKGHDAEQFRHYGPMAQDFFAAFGKDDVGTIGSPTTINSSDMAGILMIAVQALEKRTAENAELKERVEALERLVKSMN